jgi:SAM-dependent methyltransferase
MFLDYGSGTGDAVAFARYVGWNAEGIEINPRAARAGRDAGINVDEGSIEALEDRRERYHYIMSSHCVEHVPDVWRLFRAFFAALKPGGMLAIDVPNGDSLAAERFRELYYYLCMPVHMHLFTPGSIRLLAQSTGFADILTTTHSRWYTQMQSAVLRGRSRYEGSGCVRFPSHSPWECLPGRIKCLPTYILSQIQSRGDCLTMTCIRPMS